MGKKGLDVLSDVSGLRKEEIVKVFEKVKANSKRLDECEGPHEFEKQGKDIRAKYRCGKCGGELDNIKYYWYMKGLEHGKKANT